MVIRRKPLPPNPNCEFCKLGWFRIHEDYVQPNETIGKDIAKCETPELVHLVPLVTQGVGR